MKNILLLEIQWDNLLHIWETFGEQFVTLIGIVITGFFGVLLFNKGVKKERLLNKEFLEKENQEIRDRELQELSFFTKHLILLIEGVIENSLRQIDEYEAYANEILMNPKIQHLPTHRTHENITRLYNLDTQALLKVFDYKNLENTLLIKLLHDIDYLNEVFKRIPEDIHEGTGKTIIDLSNKLITIRNEILNLAAEYISKEKFENPKYNENSLWININELVINYYKDNDGIPSVEWDYNNLIIPIKSDLLKEELRYIEICDKLLNLSKIGGDIVFSIVEFSNHLAKDILKASNYVVDVCKSLEEVKDRIKGK